MGNLPLMGLQSHYGYTTVMLPLLYFQLALETDESLVTTLFVNNDVALTCQHTCQIARI